MFPSILKHFPHNNDYARATVGEIFGEDKIAKAQRFAATELRSGVFLSQSDGTYRFEPLPRIAQIAPLQGIVAGDFYGDGHAGIYAVQNSFAPIPAVGRFDGGISQMLRGDGRGRFTAVPPAESGLVVPRDAKALVVLDLDHDGWPDFLVSRNNDEVLAFRNHGVAGRKSVSISLRGPAGNPTRVGARITVELADGSTRSSEVYAGSGYCSQSTSACFFGYAEGNPPRQVRVRWPSGMTTQHPFPPGSPSLILTQSYSPRGDPGGGTALFPQRLHTKGIEWAPRLGQVSMVTLRLPSPQTMRSSVARSKIPAHPRPSFFPSNQTIPRTMKFTPRHAQLVAGSVAAISACVGLQAQTVPSSVEDQVACCSVEVSATSGSDSYTATTTLAGNRLSTDLRDIGSSLTVVTAQLLSDTGATNNTTLLQRIGGAEVGGINGNYASPGAGTSSTVLAEDTIRPTEDTRIRGLAAADNTRDFFLSDIPWDSYNTDRIDVQRGPNAILFGEGSPAGIINSASNTAKFDNSGNLDFRFGSWGSTRESLDVNFQVVPQQVAARLDFLDDRQKFEQKPAYSKDQRMSGALRIEPALLNQNGNRTIIKANFEIGRVDSDNPRDLPPTDHITPFFNPADTGAYPGGTQWLEFVGLRRTRWVHLHRGQRLCQCRPGHRSECRSLVYERPARQ